ncbi:hypothetical protein X777_04388 [Ooceraea biroi]|uniref:Uncharacterized protein n=1 Tax=Ooceraea biroi TaxID=2015173 RepID=A0A026WH88_OOCBI|nr:hypothetical protein X777_04388 [Ooceraea biroi]
MNSLSNTIKHIPHSTNNAGVFTNRLAINIKMFYLATMTRWPAIYFITRSLCKSTTLFYHHTRSRAYLTLIMLHLFYHDPTIDLYRDMLFNRT